MSPSCCWDPSFLPCTESLRPEGELYTSDSYGGPESTRQCISVQNLPLMLAHLAVLARGAPEHRKLLAGS